MNSLAPRLILTAVLGVGVWEAWRKAEADRLLWAGEFRAAIALDPMDIRPRLALAEVAATDEDRIANLTAAARLSERDDLVLQRLGLAHEIAGHPDRAEAHLLRAAELSRKYEPRWMLTNFYFRKGDHERFRQWAGQALAVAWGDPSPVFDLYMRVDRDALERAIPPRRQIRQELARYFLERGEADRAARVAWPLADGLPDKDEPVVAGIAGGLLAAFEIPTAHKLWSALRTPSLRDSSQFAWNGPLARRGLQGWRVEMDGNQPEASVLLSRVFPTEAGKRYQLRWDAETRLASPGAGLRRSGLRWRVTNWSRGDRALVAESEELAVEGRGGGVLEFQAPAASGVEVAIEYRRPLGFMRAEGSLVLISAELERLGAPE